MKIKGEAYRTIWFKRDNARIVQIIDQRLLPHQLSILDLKSSEDAATAIYEMAVRGAPLIGVTAACGMYLATLEAPDDMDYLRAVGDRLRRTRPTAVNLEWAVKRQLQVLSTVRTRDERMQIAFATAKLMMDEDVSICRRIGVHGVLPLQELSERKGGRTLNILTHCNAGWLACVDWGTATSPVYQAYERGVKLHVWVDETRPRNQGASLTAWELGQHGIPHTVIADNTGGHLMQKGMVDAVFVGADRVTANGDVANKIGTYLKALAAKDNGIPFYVAVPSSTIDWRLKDGLKSIPIEERNPDEVRYVYGLCEKKIKRVLITPESSPAYNAGFDITPSWLITSLITENGICPAGKEGLLKLFPEKRVLVDGT